MNYIAFIFTTLSIIGTVANSFKKRWCFYVWSCTNIFWCGYNVSNGMWAQALLYAFNFSTCIIGFYKWRNAATESVDFSSIEDKTAVIKYQKQSDDVKISGTECFSETPVTAKIGSCGKFEREQTDVTKTQSYGFGEMSLAVRQLAEAISTLVKVCYSASHDFVLWQFENGNPRVKHLAYNVGNYRTRKKNRNRLMREYKKYFKKRGGGR